MPATITEQVVDRWSVQLADPELENAYRLANFERDRRRLRNLVWILALMGGVSALTELPAHWRGELDLSFILPLRLFIFLSSCGFALAAGFSRSPQALEGVTVLYGAFSLAVNWLLLTRHPALDLIGPTTMLGTIVIIYAYLPVRFAVIVAIAAGSSLGMWVAWSFFRTPAPAGHYVTKAGLWLLVINVLSFINTRTLFRSERSLFARGERLERALAQEREALEHQHQFMSMITHEFRNPLAIIKSQSQVALDEVAAGEARSGTRLSAIERAALRLEGLFQQWLDSDRVADSRWTPVFRNLRLGEWLRAFGRQQRTERGERIVLQANLAALQGVRVRADEALLSVALGNLLDNALKYSPRDSQVVITVQMSDDLVGIAVSDLGRGIEEKDRERIFEKYARVFHDRGIRGLGLGLYLVRRIIDMHDGRVEVTSTVGVGSTFILWLPLSGHGRPGMAETTASPGSEAGPE